MTETIRDPEAWRQVDEGWGRRAADFASLSEPGNAREYVAMHRRLALAPSDRLLDLACGSGLALELAAAGGTTALAGLDASARLVEVAHTRLPDADLRVGDMHDLPWPDACFDVVTSFRGIWGTTPDALAEARRVLVPGGRLGLTVWGHLKASPGGWALAPFRLAAEPQRAHMGEMVALGRPGAGEELLDRFGFVDVQRVHVPFAWEYADPATYARALAATGPAYEAIRQVGEAAFVEHAVALATEQQRAGRPLRAEIDVVGYLARTPARSEPAVARPTHDATRQPADARAGSFLPPAPPTSAGAGLFAEDLAEVGYVMNASRLWAHLPDALDALFRLLGTTARVAGLTFRERGVLVLATAATLGDSYCSLAWGGKVAAVSDPDLAAAVLGGADTGLTDRERALARWARIVVGDPNATTAEDLAPLRAAGFDDTQLLALTTFAALRLAFSTVNDALGAVPDAELVAGLPGAVRTAVDWGRAPGVPPEGR